MTTYFIHKIKTIIAHCLISLPNYDLVAKWSKVSDPWGTLSGYVERRKYVATTLTAQHFLDYLDGKDNVTCTGHMSTHFKTI